MRLVVGACPSPSTYPRPCPPCCSRGAHVSAGIARASQAAAIPLLGASRLFNNDSETDEFRRTKADLRELMRKPRPERASTHAELCAAAIKLKCTAPEQRFGTMQMHSSQPRDDMPETAREYAMSMAIRMDAPEEMIIELIEAYPPAASVPVSQAHTHTHIHTHIRAYASCIRPHATIARGLESCRALPCTHIPRCPLCLTRTYSRRVYLLVCAQRFGMRFPLHDAAERHHSPPILRALTQAYPPAIREGCLAHAQSNPSPFAHDRPTSCMLPLHMALYSGVSPTATDAVQVHTLPRTFNLLRAPLISSALLQPSPRTPGLL